MTSSSAFDASQPAIGYLYQLRQALILAIQKEAEPNLKINIEKLDDVSFHDCSSAGASAIELFQMKHHVERKGGTSNSSSDVWKTLRVWANAAHNRAIDLGNCDLILLTTSTAASSHAISHLRMTNRQPEQAREELESAGGRSSNATIKACYAELMKLSAKRRKELFQRIVVLDQADGVEEVRKRLERALRYAADPSHLIAFVDRLEGWWLRITINHLANSASHPIVLSSIHRQVHDLREQFKRENLPADFLSDEVPAEAIPAEDDRMFIKQLNLIRVNNTRRQSAQVDFFKASSQRSRWIRDELIQLQELTTFEHRLVEEWKQRFEIMLEGLDGKADEHVEKSGIALYNWTQTEATNSATLLIRPQFLASYMTRGSYHMLSNELRVGWHRDFMSELKPS